MSYNPINKHQLLYFSVKVYKYIFHTVEYVLYYIILFIDHHRREMEREKEEGNNIHMIMLCQ